MCYIFAIILDKKDFAQLETDSGWKKAFERGNLVADSPGVRPVPKLADMLVAYATIPGAYD